MKSKNEIRDFLKYAIGSLSWAGKIYSAGKFISLLTSPLLISVANGIFLYWIQPKTLAFVLSSFITLVLLEFLVIFYFISKRKEAGNLELLGKLNPYIWINNWEIEAEFEELTGSSVPVYRKDTITLIALQPHLSVFKIMVLKKNGENIHLSKVEGASHSEDKESDPEWIKYSFNFPPFDPQKPEEHKIVLHWSIENMKKHSYFTQTFANFAGFNQASFSITFPTGLIDETTIRRYIKSSLIGHSLKEEAIITQPHNKKRRAFWKIDTYDENTPILIYAYSVDWKWVK